MLDIVWHYKYVKVKSFLLKVSLQRWKICSTKIINSENNRHYPTNIIRTCKNQYVSSSCACKLQILNNYKYYTQPEGLPMGTLIFSILAEIFINHSNHPIQHKQAAFHSMVNRPLNIPLNQSDYNTKINKKEYIAQEMTMILKSLNF